jgi:hypothetical protein
MKRIFLISLLAMTGLTSQAQLKSHQVTVKYTFQSETNGAKEYAKGMGMFISRPQVQKDPQTDKTTAKWYATNNSWIKDYCEVENAPIEKDILKIFPEMINLPQDEKSYMPMSWRLTAENNETVLHCYFTMPADEVTDMWLASEETCLVDQETGAQYRIRRTEPETYRKHFTIKAKKGDVVDLKVFFAPLAETTKEVRIYGVPNWSMMGAPVTVRHEAFGTFEYQEYDTIPQFRKPIVEKEHMSEDKPYDMQNWNTWKVMTDAHLIKPVKNETMAIWRTPEATYLAIGYEQNWTTEYWSFGHDIKLVDNTGHQYKIREAQGLPLDELFFMNGNSGDYVAYVLVFDPLPLELTKFTYIEPEGEPFNAWGANWSGHVLPLDVKQLRDNQKLFEYQPRIIVE